VFGVVSRLWEGFSNQAGEGKGRVNDEYVKVRL